MTKVTQSQRRAFEAMAIKKINALTGLEPVVSGYSLQWAIGNVKITLQCDSKAPTDLRLQSRLFCRQSAKPEWLDEGGYLRARRECVGWNTFFSYPSGKFNFHPDYNDMDGQERALDNHLLCIGI